MLFNSAEFLFLFLPITLGVLFLLSFLAARAEAAAYLQRMPMAWLVLASLFFYAWWEWHNLYILLGSLFFNYPLSQYLVRRTEAGRPDRWALRLGVLANIGLIAWFKYANFLATSIGFLAGEHLHVEGIVLPLAISFFTFQQISYLVDSYRGNGMACRFLEYTMVATFFPHLIAGPLVRYQKVLPQFRERRIFTFDNDRLGAGLTLFVMGLFKKMVFADSIATYSDLAFEAAGQGIVLSLTEAWVGALAYTCQLYFDFSGYSDMAIGLAWMVGIRFTLNFDSPYRATSIIDFWRRWHMTLSSFLRDYVYIPLGGNQKGATRQHLNLMLTMLVGGLWHGAGWNFVIWGGLNGLFLLINHFWQEGLLRFRGSEKKTPLPLWTAWLLMMLGVIGARVVFRADGLSPAWSILQSMVGVNGWQLPDFLANQLGFLQRYGFTFDGFTVNVGIAQKYSIGGIFILFLIALACPNTMQWMGDYGPVKARPMTGVLKVFDKFRYRPSVAWSAIAAVMAAVCIFSLTRVSVFIYFKF